MWRSSSAACDGGAAAVLPPTNLSGRSDRVARSGQAGRIRRSDRPGRRGAVLWGRWRRSARGDRDRCPPGGRDRQNHEQRGHDERPHGWHEACEAPNTCKESSDGRLSRQERSADQDEDTATDQCPKPECKAAVAAAHQANGLRHTRSDEQPAKQNAEPPRLPPSASTNGRAVRGRSVGDVHSISVAPCTIRAEGPTREYRGLPGSQRREMRTTVGCLTGCT